jgi:hypothetical protein
MMPMLFKRDGNKYRVVSDVEPADAPSWLLDMVAPIRRTQPEPQSVCHKAANAGDGSPYGLKALSNACAALANAGPGERDRAVGVNVLAIGSLAAGGELDPAYALSQLRAAGRCAVSDDSLDDKIERAFEHGMENPRRAPEGGSAERGGARTTPTSVGGKPRLFIDKGHPDRTVSNLRDILADSGRLYERGTPVRIVDDQNLKGSVAHAMTADSLALEAHFVCQP